MSKCSLLKKSFSFSKNLFSYGKSKYSANFLKVSWHSLYLILDDENIHEPNKKFVFIVDKNGVLKSRPIIVKGSMPDLFVIEGGLDDTDRILLEGVQKVKEDDKIKFEYKSPQEVIANLKLKAE